ncbi:MAG: DUF4011 domain-containing protein [Firmicutes bacterium]|nr:DUF4011 domain-containing protein [Bacillota bacterium]
MSNVIRKIEFDVLYNKYACYAMHRNNVPFINRLYVNNAGEEIRGCELIIESNPEFTLPFKVSLDLLPENSTLTIDLNDFNLSPYYLASVFSQTTGEIILKIVQEGKLLKRQIYETQILPYDIWPGSEGVTELIASFIRPRPLAVSKILKSASEVLKGWKADPDINGYIGNSKNRIREIAAAIYTALQNFEIKYDQIDANYKTLNRIRSVSEILETRRASLIEIATVYASALEAAKINSIIAIGQTVFCGFWLEDNCFLESLSDDVLQLKKRMAEGINDIGAVDLTNIFTGGKLNFAASQKECLRQLNNEDAIDSIIDIKRCRLVAIRPLPERVRTQSGGFELISEDDTQISASPQKIKSHTFLNVKTQATKERQWERRLLDLSNRNTLLSFRTGLNAAHLMSWDLNETIKNILSKEEFILLEKPKDHLGNAINYPKFNSSVNLKPLSELIKLELKNKHIRSFSDENELRNILASLYRKDRTSMEETGASTIFIAAGFLKWHERDFKNAEKYAPIVLIPVTLIKRTGGKGYSIKTREDEFLINTTLLEFLKQEFNIDIRGLDRINTSELDIDSIISTLKREIINVKDWDIVEDVYLSSFSFSRYLMWNDIRHHIEEFKNNRFVKSLAGNKIEIDKSEFSIKEVNPEDFKPADILTPIHADSYQFSAIAAAMEGKSFVLHGPPGTGKSQTITNIIANLIANGKTVLFVAEKMAALSVVKKRLDHIGIGDFCLELHSNKSEKLETAVKILNTLELKAAEANPGFKTSAKRIEVVRSELNSTIEALHKKRALNLSVYEAIIKYLEVASAPEYMNIESAFYDNLTNDSLYKYERLIENAAAAAKECGEVYRSPFADTQISEFSNRLKLNILSSSKILAEEIRHLKEYVKMCFELLGNRVRVLTKKKLNSLFNLAVLLTEKDSPYLRIFGQENLSVQETINEYVLLFKKAENYKREYNQNFAELVELPAKVEVLRIEMDNCKDTFKRSRDLKVLWKKLEKHATIRMNESHWKTYFTQVLNIYRINAEIEKAGEKVGKILGLGKMNFEKANELKEKLSILYKTAEELFPDYEYHSFNNACRTIFQEHPSMVLLSFINAYRDFANAERAFFRTLNVKGDYAHLDEDYFEFLKMKAAALIDNIDLLPSWCSFNNAYKVLEQEGLSFALQPLLDGKLNSANLVSCFRKKVYQNFIESEIADDPLLSTFSGSTMEDKIEKFRIIGEEFEKLSRKDIRRRLLERLISLDTEGPLSLEIVVLSRAVKSGMKGVTLRKLFEEIPTVMQNAAPCMLMSPISVSQYIPPKEQFFDAVIFDEASQMPTSEAIGAIARGKSIIVVGDPKQLPPTTFFSSDYTDDENLENEDLESILEDCLALGMPEKHLFWHYRSKHESLIAFSNAMYYSNKLLTFPSPDALESRVVLRYVDGIYDRGDTKQNLKEAHSLIEEVIRRLKDNQLKKESIGIVTFSSAQQSLIEDMLSHTLIKNKLEDIAYDREEPIFVKNLENVQGDERDVILFSVGYGPDKNGRLSLNFGPINQAAGWRRLNVAASRARTEMIVFSSMTSAMIDLQRTNSKGVAGLKAFLEFADKGRTMLAVSNKDVESGEKGIGYFIAKELAKLGYECKYDVGVSGFKIDTAVVDPKNKKKFILGIICDSKTAYASKSARDRTVLQIQTLKKLSWNVHKVWTLNFMNNPKREAKKIKDIIVKLSGTEKTSAKKTVNPYHKYYRDYKYAALRAETVSGEYLFEEQNEKMILAKLIALVKVEQPIAKSFLIMRCLASYGILRTGTKINARMEEICQKLQVKKEILNRTEFFSFDDEPKLCEFYRHEDDNNLKRSAYELSPYEIIAAIKSILSDKISLFMTDLITETAKLIGADKGQDYIDAIKYSIKLGVSKAILVRSQNDTVTLA